MICYCDSCIKVPPTVNKNPQTLTSVPDIVPVGSEFVCPLFSASASEVVVLRLEKKTRQRRQMVREIPGRNTLEYLKLLSIYKTLLVT